MHYSASVRKKGASKRMQITDVRVRKVAKEGKLKAVVSITMDEEFVVHDIKVIEGEKGLFIAMPSKKALDGEYRDIAHPINSGTRDRIQRIILEKYEEALEEEREGSGCALVNKIYRTDKDYDKHNDNNYFSVIFNVIKHLSHILVYSIFATAPIFAVQLKFIKNTLTFLYPSSAR